MHSLVVTAAVRVVYWVHCDSADCRVLLTSCSGPMTSCSCLEEGLLGPAVATEDADGSPALRREGLRTPTGHDDSDVVAHPGVYHS